GRAAVEILALEDHGLAAAERESRHRVLVAHALRQAQHVVDRILLRRVAPQPAAAGRGPERRRVDGDDGAKPGRGIAAEKNALVIVESGVVEDWHRLTCSSAARPFAGLSGGS